MSEIDYCNCDWDDDCPPEFAHVDNVQRSRKPHRCDECGGPIFKGEPYERTVGKWEGHMMTLRCCEPCLELRQWATISVPCFCSFTFGELHERVRSMVDDVRKHVPGFFFEYGRRMVNIRQRKRRVHDQAPAGA